MSRDRWLATVATSPWAAYMAAALGATGCPSRSVRPEPLKVAAAADLAFAFRELGGRYEQVTGQAVVFSFGSTGLLERQIVAGAPFDVFAAANVAYVDEAAAAGVCLAGSRRVYGTGRLVLFAPPGQERPASLASLIDSRVAKVALANPDHAPYGRAAREALEHEGLWQAIRSKLVYAENVQQALEFAQSGNADVAIVAMSLAIVTPGAWTPVPERLHAPIAQAIVACSGGRAGPDSGQRFVAFVASEAGHAILRRYGFRFEGEGPSGASDDPRP